jgi:SAM-dependent methyltransferase
MKLYTNLASVYHKMYQGITDYKKEFKFYHNWLEKLKCKKILEIGCGTGRLASPFVRHGYDYTGFDLSDAMLDIAKAENEGISFVQGDMRNIEISDTYDAVLITGRSFTTMVRNKDVFDALNSIKKVLRKDGFLIFDNFYADQIFRNFRKEFVQEVEVDGIGYKRTNTNVMNLETGWTWDWSSVYEIKKDNDTDIIEDHMLIRAFTQDELGIFLHLSKFKALDSTVDGSSILTVARKSE